MYRYLLFDLDGTLTDSRAGILNCVRYALEKLGEPIPPEEVLLRFIGPPLSESFRSLCGFDADKARDAVRAFRERYRPVGMFENAAAPGMPELCARMKERGCILALASSKPEAMCRPICERYGFAPSLREIVGSPPGVDWKKAQVIREAMRRLDLRESDRNAAIMVGDRRYDVEGARECGLACVGTEFFGYAEAGELEQAGALAIVHNAAELEQFFLSGCPHPPA